jgi:hypothetical protein
MPITSKNLSHRLNLCLSNLSRFRPMPKGIQFLFFLKKNCFIIAPRKISIRNSSGSRTYSKLGRNIYQNINV